MASRRCSMFAGRFPSQGGFLLGLFLTLQATVGSPPATASDGGSEAKLLTDVAMLNNNRFEVRVDWRDYRDTTGSGFVADIMTPPPSAERLRAESRDSGLFWFFSENNWEVLIKVLDGCSFNDHFWVFTAASTDVEYEIAVTDTWEGTTKTYTNPLGTAAPAVNDTSAFSEACSLTSPPPVLPGGPCVADDRTFCFGDQDRFRVVSNWEDYQSNTGDGMVAELETEFPELYTRLLSDDTGLFWFFSPDNWEVMVKVLDGCGFNNNFWVFAAATTDVEYTLRVTDTATDTTRSYFNPLGTAAPAITDTSAFATCPKARPSVRPDRHNGLEVATDLNTATAPIQFADPSDEKQAGGRWFWTSCSGFSNGIVGLVRGDLVYNPNLGWSGVDLGECVVSNGDRELLVPVKISVQGPQQAP